MTRQPGPTPRVARITAFKVPRHPAPVEVALDGNEGPAPPADLLSRVEGDVRSIINGYPSSASLQRAWAARLGVAPGQVRITAGADEAIDRIIRTFVGPGRELLTADPTFEMLERYCALAGGRYVTVPWPGPAFPTEAFVERVSPRTALVVVCTPNNPTGLVAPADAVVRLSAAAPHAVVLVDLAYVEFADEDPTAAVLQLPNVIVTRTLSKAWGLAGLRVGCAVGPAHLIAALAAAGNPYAVGNLSMAIARAALGSAADAMRDGVARVRDQRRVLSARLAALGASPGASQGNFLLARFADAPWVWAALASLGVAVRCFPDRPGLGDALRIACPGDTPRFDRLLRALDVVLSPQAIVFDLDVVLGGVLAPLPRLAARLPLAVVSRRPRLEVEGLLRRQELLDLFGAVVAVEDAPATPDPAPVRLALSRLGVDRAWMVGHTADDVAAARAAGVVPLGIVAPGDEQALAEAALVQAGAARVVGTVAEVGNLLDAILVA